MSPCPSPVAVAVTSAEFYQGTDDPWGYRTRWYERRKRDLLLAALPHPRFADAWEIGCANGELTAALAPRCDRLLATDGNARAVAIARERLAEFPHVRVETQRHPQEWPVSSEQRFALIVFSELAYYLAPDALRATARRLRASLASADGVLVACHWRVPIAGCALTGDEAHALLAEELPFTRAVRHEEADFLLEIWTADPRSVARREGLR